MTATACTVGNKGQRQQVHSELRSISVVRLDHQDPGYNRLRRNPSFLTCMFLWNWSSSCRCLRSFRHSPLFPLFPIIESWMKFFFFLLKSIPPFVVATCQLTPVKVRDMSPGGRASNNCRILRMGWGQQGGETEANWSSLGAGQGGASKAVDPV